MHCVAVDDRQCPLKFEALKFSLHTRNLHDILHNTWMRT